MKKLLALAVALMMLAPAAAAQAAPAMRPTSDPIAKGTINKVTYLYWGKSEMFPTLAMVGPGEKFDVYEYDKTWVMVLYDTWVKQGNDFSTQSFFCYVKRSDIDCDPALVGDESPKADTGPGKRKGKKPKPQGTPAAEPTAGGSTEPSAAASDEPEATPETVDDEEYDWIIRTPGLCTVTVPYEVSKVTCSFALMAQKAGGTSPSSDPAYNHGMHTPYAATAFFGMVTTMADMLEGMGVSSFLQGTGGVEITGQTGGARFYLDTGAMDPALVNFQITLQATGKANPKVTDGQITGEFETSMDMSYPLPVQLKKVGSGYQFVLKGMRPGGGDLIFPAVLEKTFADPDRWDKQARDADKQRAEAEKLRKKMLEKLKKQMQDEYNKQQQNDSGQDTATTDPMTVPGENGEDVPLAPLVTEDPLAPLVTDDPLAPLTSEDPLAPLTSEDPLAPLTPPEPPLAPLVPQQGEEVTGFPPRA